MGTFSIWHWLIVLLIVVLVFGAKAPDIGSDLGRPSRSFKDGMKDGSTSGETASAQPRHRPGHGQHQPADKTTIDVEAKQKADARNRRCASID